MATMRRYGSGWYYESARHSLAARGIQTGRRYDALSLGLKIGEYGQKAWQLGGKGLKYIKTIPAAFKNWRVERAAQQAISNAERLRQLGQMARPSVTRVPSFSPGRVVQSVKAPSVSKILRTKAGGAVAKGEFSTFHTWVAGTPSNVYTPVRSIVNFRKYSDAVRMGRVGPSTEAAMARLARLKKVTDADWRSVARARVDDFLDAGGDIVKFTKAERIAFTNRLARAMKEEYIRLSAGTRLTPAQWWGRLSPRTKAAIVTSPAWGGSAVAGGKSLLSGTGVIPGSQWWDYSERLPFQRRGPFGGWPWGSSTGDGISTADGTQQGCPPGATCIEMDNKPGYSQGEIFWGKRGTGAMDSSAWGAILPIGAGIGIAGLGIYAMSGADEEEEKRKRRMQEQMAYEEAMARSRIAMQEQLAQEQIARRDTEKFRAEYADELEREPL